MLMANAGIVRNMIPPGAQAQADIRVERIADYDGIEQKLRERMKNKLLPESQVELIFERRFPPLQPTAAARTLAAHAQRIYGELGMKLGILDQPTGGGTDAAFAALKEKGPVIESFGLRGFGCFVNLNGQALDREELFPIYERLVQYKLPVYLHPTAPLATARCQNSSTWG